MASSDGVSAAALIAKRRHRYGLNYNDRFALPAGVQDPPFSPLHAQRRLGRSTPSPEVFEINEDTQAPPQYMPPAHPQADPAAVQFLNLTFQQMEQNIRRELVDWTAQILVMQDKLFGMNPSSHNQHIN